MVALLLPAVCGALELGPVRADKSGISFISRQMGMPIEGRFERFNANIAFDPEHPEKGRAVVEIEMASIDAGNPDSNEEVRTPGWFDVERFKVAKFEAAAFKSAGAGYEAAGALTIKGVTKQVVVPFAVKPGDGVSILEGSVPISRKEYGVGTAEWAEIVGDEVKLVFRFALGSGVK